MSVNKTKLANSIMQRGHWAPVPNEIWTQPISMKAKTTYIFLLGQSDTWNPGLRGIAEGLSVAVNTARDAIAELVAANMLTVELGPLGFRNLYTFNKIEDWVALPTKEKKVNSNKKESSKDQSIAPEQKEEVVTQTEPPVSASSTSSSFTTGDRAPEYNLLNPPLEIYKNAISYGK